MTALPELSVLLLTPPRPASCAASLCPTNRLAVGVPAVGNPTGSTTPYNFNCPRGTYVTQINLRSGTRIDGFGTVRCSDGTGSTKIWGSSTGGSAKSFNSPAGVRKFDVDWDFGTLGITRLRFYVPGVTGSNATFGTTQNEGVAAVSCPSGQVVTGFFGVHGASTFHTLGLFCTAAPAQGEALTLVMAPVCVLVGMLCTWRGASLSEAGCAYCSPLAASVTQFSAGRWGNCV